MKPIKKAVIVIAVIIALPVCNIILNSTKPTEICKIHIIGNMNFWEIWNLQLANESDNAEWLYTEAYIVTNPPTDEMVLKKLIDDFIEENDLYRISEQLEVPSSFGYAENKVIRISLRFYRQSLETPLTWALPTIGTKENFIERWTDRIAAGSYSYEFPEFNAESSSVNCFMENVKPSIWDLMFMPAFTPKGWDNLLE